MKAKNDVGKIIQKARLSNSAQMAAVRAGKLPRSRVRSLEVAFLVDTAAAMICLPPKEIETLGLRKLHERDVVTANGLVKRGVYEPVRLQVMDREADLNVMDVPTGTPPLLGYLPLDQQGGELIGLVESGSVRRYSWRNENDHRPSQFNVRAGQVPRGVAGRQW
ncbi:MAG: aspartyl protease [Verrucomicrobia bacterium]|nr:aspartyl protease [Verrucomicrobiota bacterium]